MSKQPRKVKVMERIHLDGAWRTVVKCDSAVFHGFGCDYEEFETGAGNYSVAIVEYADGSVEMVRADRVQFLAPEVSL